MGFPTKLKAMDKKIMRLPFCFVCSMLVCLSSAHAAVRYVNSGASAGGDGTSWEMAYQGLQPALDEAGIGDEIWVAHGTYYPTDEHGGSGDRYQSFQMKNNVTIIGGFQGGETAKELRTVSYHQTILSGDIGVSPDTTDNCYHVFYHPAGTNLNDTAVLDGVTITGGNADGTYPHDSGGGMFNAGSSPTLRNCMFMSNEAAIEGGGIYNSFLSSPVMINCTLANNTSGTAGGGMANDSSSPTLTNCVVWGNTSDNEPGLKIDTLSTPAISHCNIQGSGGSGLDWVLNIHMDLGNNVDSDPLFVDLSNGDLHLRYGSPCIDSGDNDALDDGIDMDGEDRFTDSDGDRIATVDMGVDEYISSDGDTLSDYEEETIYGTNKDVADSDGDGLTDGREVSLWGGQWGDDPDGDGLINILDPDSDGNGVNDNEADFATGGGGGGGCFILSL